ncbi:MAG: glycosyltransferase, partial [Streptococcaceae bacterium]|nr:glycosyltransferase [Streptococcaceae bacterium]
ILEENDVQIVLLGTGDAEFEDGFKHFAYQYPEKMAVSIAFDVKVAQLIYAGADMFLMPSAFEPCGLSQMISMRYGTLPIVHEVGGLKDTVLPYNQYTGEGTGFGFDNFDSYYLRNTVSQAVSLFHNNKEDWKKMQTQAMLTDNSWQGSSDLYLDMFNQIS